MFRVQGLGFRPPAFLCGCHTVVGAVCELHDASAGALSVPYLT